MTEQQKTCSLFSPECLLLILYRKVYEIWVCVYTILTNGCLDFPFATEKFKITFPEVLPTTAFIHHSQPVVWTVTVPTNLVRAFLSAELNERQEKPAALFAFVLLNYFQFVFPKQSAT